MRHMFIISEPMLDELGGSSSMHLVLPHLYKKHPQYVEYYRKRAEQGDWIMQDNSLFELKTIVAGDLIKFAEQIRATEIVVPEVLRDKDASVAALNQFFYDTPPAALKKYKFCCVLQAASYERLAEYYQYVDESFDEVITTIGIPFDIEYDAFNDHNEEKQKTGFNRFSVIKRLVEDQVWNCRKSHHLFGLFNPAELPAYRASFPQFIDSSIRSNDSSSCFWHSMYGVRYHKDCGLLYKKIESHVDFSATYSYSEQYNCFWQNRDLMLSFSGGNGGEYMLKRYKEWLDERPTRGYKETKQAK